MDSATRRMVGGWAQRRTDSQVLNGLRPMVEDLAQRTGQPVALVGWSLGGSSRGWSRARCQSPCRRSSRWVRRFAIATTSLCEASTRSTSCSAGTRPDGMAEEERNLPPLPVPATSIYSRLDGIVDWRTCIDTIDERHENIQVYASHLGWDTTRRSCGLSPIDWVSRRGRGRLFSAPWYARLHPSPHDARRRPQSAAAA